MSNFIESVKADLKRMRHAPAIWAESWGREMGIYGVATKEDDGERVRAGLDDSLDAFRHAFVSAAVAGWTTFLSAGLISRQDADEFSQVLGDLNEERLIGGASADLCSRHMDLHNNYVGRYAAPDAESVYAWLVKQRVNPNRKIAERIRAAFDAGQLITRFDDPRMPSVCHLKAKVHGTHYVWKTVGDEKVRWKHAMRNGKTFAWNELPPGELPGQEFECRCWAEPVKEKEAT